jgi:serine/threonine-protein kinase RsbW
MKNNYFPESPELKISIPAKTGLLKMVVDLTKHMALINDFDKNDAQKIALAVDEAVTNIIKHSYNYEEDNDIIMEFFISQNKTKKGLKILLIFSGEPPILKDTEIDLNKMIKQKKKGGIGVEIMKKIMDSVQYGNIKNKNFCEMVKWAKV